MRKKIDDLLEELAHKDKKENEKIAQLNKARAAAKGIKLKPKPPQKPAEGASLGLMLRFMKEQKMYENELKEWNEEHKNQYGEDK